VPATARPAGAGGYRLVAGLPTEGDWRVTDRHGHALARLLVAGRGAPPPAPASLLRGRVAYSDRRGHLWTMDADGRARRPLPARRGATDFDPSWAPDGRRVVFRTASDHDGIPDPHGIGLDSISVISLGSRLRQGVNPPTGGLFPAWSPDGRWISFAGVAGPADRLDRVFLMRPDGARVHALTRRSGEDSVWSPHGRRLVFGGHDGDGNFQIWRIDADGTGLRKLTQDRDGVQHPIGWSPDGRRIVFSSDRSGSSDVYVMDADGRRQRPLVRGPAAESPAAWLPRGIVVYAVAQKNSLLPHWRLLDLRRHRRWSVPQLYGATDPIDWLWRPRR
jgi:Tol biopolymer transport system component